MSFNVDLKALGKIQATRFIANHFDHNQDLLKELSAVCKSLNLHSIRVCSVRKGHVVEVSGNVGVSKSEAVEQAVKLAQTCSDSKSLAQLASVTSLIPEILKLNIGIVVDNAFIPLSPSVTVSEVLHYANEWQNAIFDPVVYNVIKATQQHEADIAIEKARRLKAILPLLTTMDEVKVWTSLWVEVVQNVQVPYVKHEMAARLQCWAQDAAVRLVINQLKRYETPDIELACLLTRGISQDFIDRLKKTWRVGE